MEEFIKTLAALFPNTDISEFTPDTEFKYLNDWSSMTGLLLVALLEDDYDTSLTNNDIREIETVEELYNLIKK